MKIVPKPMPRILATMVHRSDRCIEGPMKPIGMEKYWKLPRNHRGPWCQTFPCRSFSGTQSIDRASSKGRSAEVRADNAGMGVVSLIRSLPLGTRVQLSVTHRP